MITIGIDPTIELGPVRIAWLRARLQPRPLALTWLVVALAATGRFIEFFRRADSPDLALGLETAQWTSLLLLAVAWHTLRRRTTPRGCPKPSCSAARRHHRPQLPSL